MESFDPSHLPGQVKDILSLLRPALPLCLPLYRRIQFAHFTPTSRITASLPLEDDDPWLVCFSDPDRGPETQLFLYGSWESAHSDTIPKDPRVRALLAQLVSHLRTQGLFAPPLRTPRVRAMLAAAGGASYDPAADARHLVLCGSVHASSALLLADMGLVDPSDGGVDDMPERYNKWVFDLRGGQQQQQQQHGAEGEERLPKGLRWGALKAKHYPLIRSRTAIARQDRTLRMLPDLAIFPVGQNEDVYPVAWMFLGVDSSLTTMHVEPEYRGRGLAKALARKAWRDHLDYYTTAHLDVGTLPEERWAHADVAAGNVSSNAVCKSLGGQIMWADYWITIDLARPCKG